MRLTPVLKQTLVSPYSRQEVLKRLTGKTQIISGQYQTKDPVFNGQFCQNRFSLSLIISYAQNAIPLVKGTVESTSRGSIVFLRLQLFPAAKLYLILFTSLAGIIALVFALISNNILFCLLALLGAVINYIILTINFSRKARESIDLIKEILASPN